MDAVLIGPVYLIVTILSLLLLAGWIILVVYALRALEKRALPPTTATL